MKHFEFSVPPLPHYILSGEDTYIPNQAHPNRRNIDVFDLIVVTKGELFIGEEEGLEWELGPGHMLILRPDKYHYALKPCVTETHFYWVHFQTKGTWQELDDHEGDTLSPFNFPIPPFHQSDLFRISLPRTCTLTNKVDFFEKLQKLILLSKQPSLTARWQEQTLFQELLVQLHGEQKPRVHSSVIQVAEKAAHYLQQNFQKTITNEKLSEELNFHPVYITRCMKQVYGCTPQEYVKKYRIEQAKIYLLNSDISIGEISERVGFSTIQFFTRSFSQQMHITPLKFRQQYR